MAVKWQERQVEDLAFRHAVVSEGRSQPFAHAPAYPIGDICRIRVP